ncbi:MAG: hypothetical protein BIP78_0202 [Candidatus Bipolaricaulis sibiricus]|uniref:Uncharacterized protein n=1 Tax=Bipolaricaulis sibiricus TaxID=2501609 RepID=A0A410FSR5_BIPS1|nr:MAG: hypothetical protein BIP78_0202 [Candidatus Bipolaricaulis sibiricus]
MTNSKGWWVSIMNHIPAQPDVALSVFVGVSTGYITHQRRLNNIRLSGDS